jgi:hypothetical protein
MSGFGGGMSVGTIEKMAGAVLGTVAGIGSIFATKRANKELDRILAKDPTYKENPLAAQRLAYAQNLLNARTPGASYAEQNLFRSGANSMQDASRNATDGSQLLAMGGAIQGQQDNALMGLSQQENADYYRRLQEVNQARALKMNEDDKLFADEIRKHQNYAQIKGAQHANRLSLWQGLGNAGLAMYSQGSQNSGGVPNFASPGISGAGGGTMGGGGQMGYWGNSGFGNGPTGNMGGGTTVNVMSGGGNGIGGFGGQGFGNYATGGGPMNGGDFDMNAMFSQANPG